MNWTIILAIILYLMSGGGLLVITDALMLDGELERWKAWTLFLLWPLVIAGVMAWAICSTFIFVARRLF